MNLRPVLKIYRVVSKRMISDLAKRRDVKGNTLARGRRRWEVVNRARLRVRLWGDTICHSQHYPFFDSDFPWRVTMAVTAEARIYRLKFGKRRGANWYACKTVAKRLLKSDCKRLRDHAMKGKRGPKPKVCERSKQGRSRAVILESRDKRFQELDAAIALESKQRSKNKPGKKILCLAYRLHQTAYKYRNENPLWKKQFQNELGATVFEISRDSRWYEKNLPKYKKRLRWAEGNLGCYDRHTASETLSLARFFLEAGDYSQADRYFRLAAGRWKHVMTPIPEGTRDEALDLCKKGTAAAQAHQCPDFLRIRVS